MHTRNYLMRVFRATWRGKTGHSFPLPLKIVAEVFNIENIDKNINSIVGDSEDKLESEKYQKKLLRVLTIAYINILLEYSHSGKKLNKKMLIEAKTQLKIMGKCEIHPC